MDNVNQTKQLFKSGINVSGGSVDVGGDTGATGYTDFGPLGVGGYESGDFVPLIYSSGVNTGGSSTSSSTYSGAPNMGSGVVSWDMLEPTGGTLAVGFFGRATALNGTTLDVRVWNNTDGETMVERTGISSTGPLDIGVTSYTPTTTGPIRFITQIANGDNASAVDMEDGSPVIGVII